MVEGVESMDRGCETMREMKEIETVMEIREIETIKEMMECYTTREMRKAKRYVEPRIGPLLLRRAIAY
ncbi:hypothetical protein L3X38_042926 [Prunus dulcis]|uniref:Uncharacterized protein n=1 Tax=Prunus dulcis TaxID=3755 RepID=A0AAD4YLS1_PRUDU|nr:hypothetical protein L3X38_042926 [Prunus dulcis]